jgi:Di-haem oxidoreductase, putative peroxidase
MKNNADKKFSLPAGAPFSARCLALTATLMLATAAHAQLTDVSQTTPIVPGGAIGKSLAAQVGTGHGDELTPGSAVYLIKRDPARSIRRGRQIFQRKFTLQQGLGPRVGVDSSGNIQSNAAFGAGLSDSCASCHGRPRGSAGAGGDVATRPDSRDAPHLFGAGLKEMLADEITMDLRAIRSRAVQLASARATTVALYLTSKGIQYGIIQAQANGTIDTSRVQGVDADLRVRPFFHDGREFSLRAFAVGAFKDEMGLESPDPLLCAATRSSNPVKVTTPAGMVLDPALDRIKPAPLCGASADGDLDGVTNEIDPALIDHMEFYLLNYFKPGTGQTTEQTEHGLRLMRAIGCTNCHVQNLKVEHDRRVADLETRFDPEKGIFNRLFATATTLFKAVPDGQFYPQLLPQGQSFLVRNFFSDLKRHDLGAAFHERNYDGTLTTRFMTEPLWGVATTAPYGHDGRSINLTEVILRHGGEAAASEQAFAALDEREQRHIVDFLSTLVLFPPDDTASTLNPGKPGTFTPQDPSEHGGISLSVLFQISSEGPE